MKNIAKKTNTIDILNRYQLTASKKFGQNFLVDPHVIAKIADKASITKKTCVIEVGPGIGALTEALAQRAGHVRCYEIDERLEEVLEETVGSFSNVEIIFQDFLKVDLDAVASELSETYDDLCVVTNLPYYITSDIISKVVKSDAKINRLVAMVQKEVALKLCSEEKSPLRFYIDYVGDISYEMTVSKAIFIPAPHVDSAVIKITKERSLYHDLEVVIEAAFKAKRKTIANNMKPLFKEKTGEVLEECGIPANQRAQAMSIEDFVALAKERKHVS